MEQEIQSQPVKPKKKPLLAVIVSVVLTALIVGAGIYFWQKSAHDAVVKDLEQQALDLRQQISIMKIELSTLQLALKRLEDLPITPTGTTAVFIPEVGLTATFPNNLLLQKVVDEGGYRSPFVSYEFQQSKDLVMPPLGLGTLLFFSEKSIADYAKYCETEDAMCFAVDPTPVSYYGQKAAFAKRQNYQDREFERFGTRFRFVSQNRNIKKYTTFLGDTELDVSIELNNSWEGEEADALFAQFKIE
jgi:type II secretory pathway pseudopilin PulG